MTAGWVDALACVSCVSATVAAATKPGRHPELCARSSSASTDGSGDPVAGGAGHCPLGGDPSPMNARMLPKKPVE